MLDFLEESRNFNSVTFNGCFDIDRNDLRKLYSHYLDTGKNLLDDYCRIIYESWDTEPVNDPYSEITPIIHQNELNEIRVAVSHMRKLRLFDPEELRRIEYRAKCKYENYQEILEKGVSEERREACKHTRTQSVRDKVFELHGDSCLNCGSSDNMTIDHVIPVSKGGENCIENYQPLCLSCNTKKGIQTTDYR